MTEKCLTLKPKKQTNSHKYQVKPRTCRSCITKIVVLVRFAVFMFYKLIWRLVSLKVTFEPPHEKINNVVFEKVRYKLACIVTEDG